jgi:hypothetical protein
VSTTTRTGSSVRERVVVKQQTTEVVSRAQVVADAEGRLRFRACLCVRGCVRLCSRAFFAVCVTKVVLVPRRRS